MLMISRALFSGVLFVLLYLVKLTFAHGDEHGRVDIPIHHDSEGHFIIGVTMSSGSTAQVFNFTFSTGTGLIYVAGSPYTSYATPGVPLYNASASSTAQAFTNTSSASIFGEPINTTIVKEECGLANSAQSLWSYENQTIVVVNRPLEHGFISAIGAQVGRSISGIIGLGTNRAPANDSGSSASQFKATFEDSVIGQWLHEYGDESSFTFGLALGDPVILPRESSETGASYGISKSTGGMLHLTDTDTTMYEPDNIVWVPAGTATQFQMDMGGGNGDWDVIMDGWTFKGPNNQLQSQGQILTTMDPLYTDIYLPSDQAKLIHAAIPGAVLRPNLSTLGNLAQAWSIPCDSRFSLGVSVGAQTFTLDQSQLVIRQPDGMCVSAMEGWTNSFQTNYVFGARFLSTVYMIFKVHREGTQMIGIAPRIVASNSKNLGPIIGGAVGGGAVFLLSVMGFTYLYILWRRSKKAEPAAGSTDPSFGNIPMKTEPFEMGNQFIPQTPSQKPGWEPSPMPSPAMDTALLYGNGPQSVDAHGHSAPPVYRPNSSHAASQVLGGGYSMSDTERPMTMVSTAESGRVDSSYYGRH